MGRVLVTGVLLLAILAAGCSQEEQSVDLGPVEEIAGLAVYLCSDEAAFVTGSAYDIDGGSTLLR